MGPAPEKRLRMMNRLNRSKKMCAKNLWLASLLLFTTWGSALGQSDALKDGPTVILVIGEPGNSEYSNRFAEAASDWKAACQTGQINFVEVGLSPQDELNPDFLTLSNALTRISAQETTNSSAVLHPLWLVLHGHGTFDDKVANFNLRGPDISSAQLKTWLNHAAKKQPTRQQVVIVASAASSPFLTSLKAENRVVITATKSPTEDSYVRFGEFFAKSIAAPTADLDNDGGTSLLEATLAAAKKVEGFYAEEGRLQNEEALIDDNSDGKGTPAAWFRGVRAIQSPKEGAPDGFRSHQLHLFPSPEEQQLTATQRSTRDALEKKLYALRMKKKSMPEAAYFAQLEQILLQIGEIYHPSEVASETPSEPSSEPSTEPSTEIPAK